MVEGALRTTEVHPNAENATLEELRLAMEAAPTKRSYIRLNAIRSLLLGISRSIICQQFCRSDRMIRITRPRPNRLRKVKL